jgi:hypothetical protein
MVELHVAFLPLADASFMPANNYEIRAISSTVVHIEKCIFSKKVFFCYLDLPSGLKFWTLFSVCMENESPPSFPVVVCVLKKTNGNIVR